MVVSPKLYGRYLPLDSNGRIINDRSTSKIQGQWKPLLDDLVGLFKENEPSLHSVYVRGSVADGRAIDGISDVDSFAVINTDEDVPMLNCNWIDQANNQLRAKYPFCDGVETYLLPKSRLFSDRKTAFYLQTQSVCIYGDDVIPQLQPYRVGEEATFSHAKNLEYDLGYIRSKLYLNDDPNFVRSCCKKIMKRIVRAAMETCMVEQGRYTRDLFLSHEMFALSNPEEAGRIAKAMHYALNPISDQSKLLQGISETGDWLVYHIQQKFGKETREVSFIDDFGFGDALEPDTQGVSETRKLKWHKIDRSLDPVEAAIEFGKAMTGDQRDPVLFSVGSETEKIALPHSEIITSPGYNRQGGEYSIREQAASWVRRFLGIPAYAENTFLLQQNGRVALSEAFTAASIDRNDPSVLIPDLRWPMLSQKIAQARMQEHEYKIARAGTAEDIVTRLQGFDDAGICLSALYTNYPHNPTGLAGSKQEIALITAKINEINTAREAQHKIFHVIDNPYFSGCSQKDSGAHLYNPYEGNLAYKGQTPWLTVLSFSKAFGVSSPGTSIVVTDESTQADFDKQLVSGVGISYSPEFLKTVCDAMKPENDDYVLEHFDSLRRKYKQNHGIVSNSLQGYMADGDPNLTTVLEFPKEMVRQEIKCSDGIIRSVRDMNDLVEIFGNAGVVTVNCSTRDRNLVRLALSGKTETVQRGVNIINDTVQRLECTL